MHIQTMCVDSTQGEKDKYTEANCDGNCNKEIKIGKEYWCKVQPIRSKIPEQQMHNAEAVFELQENMKSKDSFSNWFAQFSFSR